MTEVRRKIVVGVDSSAEARQALAWAQGFAGPSDEIVAIHAWEPPNMAFYAPVQAPVPPVRANDIERSAEAVLAQLVADTGDDRVVGMVRQGRPGQTIVAEASDADVVVVGHSGDSQISMMLGSTANYVLHNAPQPVVVVHGDASRAPRRVVVGVDDQRRSDEDENASVRALRWAYGLNGIEEIRVLHAWSIQPFVWDFVAHVPQYLNELDEDAAAVVGRVVDAAGEPPPGVKLIEESVRDTPSHAMIDASVDTDLVVVGSRGRGGFAGLVLGSTSQAVAAHGHVPVAVIR
jgi:nucleotide-binding universal stress UspA family protein